MENTKRNCLRCGTEMKICYVQDGDRIRKASGKLRDINLGVPCVAVCPECGEISWYVNPVLLSELKD